ncbi:hypothetical protein TWF506_009423 [Arthrobotrys conoides]|uniref:Uncharacterized protein n=1 Tax=Arthrobotrys conoides TaxID=74498 RepID=A0AAN8PET7_9PEZI
MLQRTEAPKLTHFAPTYPFYVGPEIDLYRLLSERSPIRSTHCGLAALYNCSRYLLLKLNYYSTDIVPGNGVLLGLPQNTLSSTSFEQVNEALRTHRRFCETQKHGLYEFSRRKRKERDRVLQAFMDIYPAEDEQNLITCQRVHELILDSVEHHPLPFSLLRPDKTPTASSDTFKIYENEMLQLSIWLRFPLAVQNALNTKLTKDITTEEALIWLKSYTYMTYGRFFIVKELRDLIISFQDRFATTGNPKVWIQLPLKADSEGQRAPEKYFPNVTYHPPPSKTAQYRGGVSYNTETTEYSPAMVMKEFNSQVLESQGPTYERRIYAREKLFPDEGSREEPHTKLQIDIHNIGEEYYSFWGLVGKYQSRIEHFPRVPYVSLKIKPP